MRGPIYLLGVAAIIANATDLLSTLIALSLGAVELNTLYTTLGPLGFFMLKIFLPTCTIAAGLCLVSKNPKNRDINLMFTVIFICVIAIFAFATINNIGVIINAT
jgi:hypothetical protein